MYIYQMYVYSNKTFKNKKGAENRLLFVFFTLQ